MVDRFEKKLGTYKGRKYLLYWEARPNIDELEEFVVNISYSDFINGEPKRIQIVRIDNVGKPLHIDQLWREGNPKRWLNWRGSRWKKFSLAIEELKENWKRYAKNWEASGRYRQ